LNLDADNSELVLTLILMTVLLVVAVVAVVVFFLVWRKENKGRGRNFFE
jgi:heme/copper-type cytochrome/quinol oxidase subunit 2